MHLPYLTELSDHFELAALCDLSEAAAAGCAERYRVPRVHTRWQDLLSEELDAVLILTSGDHAPIAIEKPMALNSGEAQQMVEAARRSDVNLMVGTMKRYDPAYERLAELLQDVVDLRLVRVTTLESPLEPYVAHYPLIKGEPPPPEIATKLRADEEAAVHGAIGEADEEACWCYRWILLDNLVHELNALRGVLGEPDEIRSAQLAPRCVSVNMRFGDAECQLSWVDLPGIARYRQEFAFYTPDQRLILELPSPFLRSMPSRLFIEGGEPGTTHSWYREEIVSYDEAFKRELVEFAECVASSREPRTSGEDGLPDILLCEAIARAHLGRDAAIGPPLRAASGVGGRT
jgi:predicted dehydrogenase